MTLLKSKIYYWRDSIKTIFCVSLLVQHDALQAPEPVHVTQALIPEAGDNVYLALFDLTAAALKYLRK